MKVSITCKSQKVSDDVYTILTDSRRGKGVLKGKKVCINSHEAIPDIMEFDLTREEMAEVRKIEGVLFVNVDDVKIRPDYTKIGQIGIPKLASYTTNFNGNSANDCIPHSLYYGQNYDIKFTHEYPTNGLPISLSSIDCSNVDILIMDSGIDPTHPDFKDDSDLDTVVQFDWTQLKSGDPVSGTQIIPSQSANYYQDTSGHGTSCASLIAGKRCGFAKNAQIYSIRSNDLGNTLDGFGLYDCISLALSFQKSKQLNLFGLLSSRPTIFSNSWGYYGPYITDDYRLSDQNNLNFCYSIDEGKNYITYNEMDGYDFVVDGYFREIINQGVHTCISAGNSNIYLSNNPVSSINLHYFYTDYYDYVIVRTQENASSFVSGNTYYGYTYDTSANRYLYNSPNIGVNYDKKDYPVIIVGDIVPVGYNDTPSNSYWSGGNALTSYSILSALSGDSRIITDTTTRYPSISGPFFTKSAYSSFGSDVDIYAPGNGTWAALSNQTNTTVPTMTANNNPSERYKFFNGTSAACPIVAGILATYLSEYPLATTTEAKTWLLDNAVRGNILQTEMTTLPVSSYNGLYTEYLDMPFGPNLDELQSNSAYRMQNTGGSYEYMFGTGNIEDLLYCNRFFGSNNLIAQAHPLRKAVLYSNSDSVTINGTTLVRGLSSSEKITHSV